MSRTYEYYRSEFQRSVLDDLRRQEQERDEQEKYDFEQQYEEEKWYHEQMELMKETDDISEIPSTEEDLFRQIVEDERNEIDPE